MGCEHLIAQPVLPFPSYREKSDLVVLDRFGSGEPIYTDIFEVFRQGPRTSCQLPLWNDKEENATRHDPTSCMPQEYNFHALIVGLADFEVIRRIQIDKGQGVHAALDLEGVAMHNFDSKRARLLRAVGIEFYAVAQRVSLVEDRLKCRAVSHTWVESCKGFGREDKVCSEASSFALGKRVEAKLQSACVSHGKLRYFQDCARVAEPVKRNHIPTVSRAIKL